MKHLIRLALVTAAFILNPFVWQLHFDSVNVICESQLGETINQLNGAMHFVVTESLVRFPFGPFCFLLGMVGGFALRSSNEELLIWIPAGLLLRTVANWTTADVDWDTLRLTGFVTEMLAEASAVPLLLIGFRVGKIILVPRMLRWRIGDLLLIVLAASLILASSRHGQSSIFGFSVGVLLLSAVLAMLLNQCPPKCREDDEPSVATEAAT